MFNDLFKHENPLIISFEDYINIFYYNFFLNWKDVNSVKSQKDFESKYLVNKLPNDLGKY